MVDLNKVYKIADQMGLKIPFGDYERSVVSGVVEFPYGREIQTTIEFSDEVKRIEAEDLVLYIVGDTLVGAYNSIYYDFIYQRYGKLVRVEDRSIVYRSGKEETSRSIDDYLV